VTDNSINNNNQTNKFNNRSLPSFPIRTYSNLLNSIMSRVREELDRYVYPDEIAITVRYDATLKGFV
jgi:hypothetical protein